MKNYKNLIDPGNIPNHVAIIMDGNGRWAKKHSLPRSEGHRCGADALVPLLDAALAIGIGAVSLYTFSTENWVRPPSEVRGLWKLLEYFFSEQLDTLIARGVQVRHSGASTRLPASVRKIIARAVDLTGRNSTIVLNFCINYGGRQEIVSAVNAWMRTCKGNEELTEAKLERHLYTAGMPQVDLMIRTSGEFRLSNFMLWQLAYAELVFMDVLWPDFSPGHLFKAVYEYQQRERRFGGL